MIGSKRRKAVFNLSVAMMVLVWGLMIFGVEAIQAAPANKRVLLIHSYHPDYPTFFELTEGVRDGLAQAGFAQPALVFDIEFMDVKRFYSEEAVSAFYERLSMKLSKLPPYDVILTADDIASQSAIQRQSQLFGDAPIVFFGVNDRPFAMKQNQNPNVTGVIEAASMLETAELASRLSREKPLIVVTDSTPSGIGNLRAFQEEVKNELGSSSRVLSLGDMTFEELKTSLRSFSKEHSLILLSAFRDKTGKTVSFQEAMDFVVTNFSGPVFRMWRPGIGQGVLGGIVISHFEQGKNAATLAASILNGKSAANLRVIDSSPNIPLFDYRVVERHKILRSELPEGSVFINEPPAKFFFSKTTIAVVVLIVVLLAIFTIILLLSKSQLHKATATLRESEAYYRSIFENVLYGIAITGSDFKFTKVNESWCQLIGYSEEELLNNMGIADVTLPDSFPESKEMMGKLINRKVREGRLEKRYKTKSGEIIDAMTFVRGIYDANDHYLGNAASILDITERKRGELALKISEAKYRRIFESVEDGYIFADMEGTILSVNPATARMLKYDTPGLLVGKNMIRDIYTNTQQREAMMAALKEKGKLKGHLLEFKRQDGEVISAECNVHLVFDDADLPVAIEGTFRDVTERNRAEIELEQHREHLEELVEERTRELTESEKKYEDLYENAPDMFATVEAKTGNIIQCNQTFLKKTNFSKDEIIGKHIFKIYHKDCLYKVKTSFKQFQDTGEIHNAELIIERKDGSSLDVILNVTAIRDENGIPVFSRSIWIDISARKEAERKVLEAKEAVEKANDQLQELDRLKSMFIASMSHEFRTPLNSIIGFTGILLMEMVGKLEPKQKDFLTRANLSSKHLLALVNDIIDISKIEAGKIESFNSPFMLDQVIDDAVNDVEPIRNKKGLKLRVNVPDNVKMDTDRKRVYQCILNLISNAVKYTEKGWVSITARQLNGEAEIVVEDTGIGIDEKDLRQLFQPFVRLDSSLRNKELGTGLGLYLTKKMASEILGGSVSVEGRLGVGSKFFLFFPMHRQSHEKDIKNHSPKEQT